MAKKARRESTARRKAADRASGKNRCYKLPAGIEPWKPTSGKKKISIVPFTAGALNKFAGELHFESTYWRYAQIGQDNLFVLAEKTFANLKDKSKVHKDYVAQHLAKLERNNPEIEYDDTKPFRPKERQLWLIWDHDDMGKGIQVWDQSWHKFGTLLEDRITASDEEDGWDGFYFPDEDGMVLSLTMKDQSFNGNKYVECVAIDFKRRGKALPERVLKQAFCLDDIYTQLPYEDLRDLFLQKHEDTDGPEEDEDDDSDPFGDDDDDDDADDSGDEETPRDESPTTSETESDGGDGGDSDWDDDDIW